jgi:hypothetical protein
VTDKSAIVLEEKISLIEKEVATLTQKVEEMAECLREFEDLRVEIAGLKLFLGRENPAFKDDFPGIVQKVAKKGCVKSTRGAKK